MSLESSSLLSIPVSVIDLTSDSDSNSESESESDSSPVDPQLLSALKAKLQVQFDASELRHRLRQESLQAKIESDHEAELTFESESDIKTAIEGFPAAASIRRKRRSASEIDSASDDSERSERGESTDTEEKDTLHRLPARRRYRRIRSRIEEETSNASEGLGRAS